MDPIDPNQATEVARESTDRKRARFAELGSIVALATSFFALSLSAYQARLMNPDPAAPAAPAKRPS